MVPDRSSLSTRREVLNSPEPGTAVKVHGGVGSAMQRPHLAAELVVDGAAVSRPGPWSDWGVLWREKGPELSDLWGVTR